jgi:hypothetical protein
MAIHRAITRCQLSALLARLGYLIMLNAVKYSLAVIAAYRCRCAHPVGLVRKYITSSQNGPARLQKSLFSSAFAISSVIFMASLIERFRSFEANL